MPFRSKSRKAWRAQVKWGGKVYRADFPTRAEAVAWEARKRLELEQETITPNQTGMGLLEFSNRYLDYSRIHHVHRPYYNKRLLCTRLLEFLGDIPVNDFTTHHLHEFLNTLAASPSKHNEAYKNLHSMWVWGERIYDLERNPVAKLRRLPHDRAPQYTPPTQDVR